MVENNDQVALYVRVSTEEQVDGHSLEAQEAVLRKDVQQRGKRVFRVYRDAGVSGVRNDRDGMNTLLHDARNGYFNEVLVWTVSRASRSLSYLLTVVEELKSLNIAFRSLSEQFDVTAPMGHFALTMLGAVAQMQRDSWMESSRISMDKRARSGRWTGGIMLGYGIVPDEQDPRGGGKLAVIPREADIVRTIFSFAAQGMGLKMIANQLNEKGQRGKTGQFFTVHSVQKILTNPVYIGQVRYSGQLYTGIHEAIIDNDIWQEVQGRLHHAPEKMQKVIDYEYLLSGLLKCPMCGSGMLPMHSKQHRKNGKVCYYYYYACGAYLNRGRLACHANCVRAEEADVKILRWLTTFLTNPFWVRRVALSIQQENATSSAQLARRQVEQHLTKLASEQATVLRQYEEGKMTKNDFVSIMQQMSREKETCCVQLSAGAFYDQRSIHWSVAEITQAFCAFRQVLDHAGSEQKRALIRQVIAKIHVNKQRQMTELEIQPVTALLASDVTGARQVAV